MSNVDFRPGRNYYPGERHGCLHPSRSPFRFVLLTFTCMMTFGSYFCYDMPSVLQTVFVGVIHPKTMGSHFSVTCIPYHERTERNPNKTGNCSSIRGVNGDLSRAVVINGSACTAGLGLTQTQFNLLYSIYAWTNAVVVVLAGFLIDKLGNGVGALLFSFMCLVGTSTFAVGLYLQANMDTMFAVMLLGRILFGSGNGSLTIVQNRICAIWFKQKELAFAFGCILAFSRLGSVLNFFLTESFEEKHGLQWTLWGGAILCAFGVICAVIATVLDHRGLKLLDKKVEMDVQSKKMNITDIRFFSSSYWLLALTLMFFYNGIFPFVSDASDFIKSNYKQTFHFNAKTSAYIAGAVYDVSMVLGPFMGVIVDNFGRRGYLSLMCALSTIPVYALLSFVPKAHPLISTLWLGLNYSIAAASLWPSVPLVVNQAVVGTALGLTTTIQMIGIGLCNLVVGKILDMKSSHHWQYMMIFLLANTLACVAFAVMLNINDYRKGGILNLSTKRRQIEDSGFENSVPSIQDKTTYLERDALLYDSTSSIN